MARLWHAGEDDVGRGLAAWLQVDRRVRLNPGGACIVAEGRRPSAGSGGIRNPVQAPLPSEVVAVDAVGPRFLHRESGNVRKGRVDL